MVEACMLPTGFSGGSRVLVTSMKVTWLLPPPNSSSNPIIRNIVQITIFFFKWDILSLFLFIFGLFQTSNKFFTINYCEKCPSCKTCMQCCHPCAANLFVNVKTQQLITWDDLAFISFTKELLLSCSGNLKPVLIFAFYTTLMAFRPCPHVGNF